MRTLAIALIAALVFLLSQKLTAADDDRHDQEARGASQAVIAGSIKCFFEPEVHVALDTFGGLGILAIPRPPEQFSSFAIFAGPLAEECSDLIPFLVEQFPRRVCEIGGTFQPGEGVEVPFVCTGRADAVISAVGKMANVVIRLGQS
jgi:hypothetical protein